MIVLFLLHDLVLERTYVPFESRVFITFEVTVIRTGQEIGGKDGVR